MKIDSSAISMSSDRKYASYFHKEEVSLTLSANQAATLEFSKESKNLTEQLKDNEARMKKELEEQQKENVANMLERRAKETGNAGEVRQIKSAKELKLELVQQMLEALKRTGSKNAKMLNSQLKKLRTAYQNEMKKSSEYNASMMIGGGSVPSAGNVAILKKVTATSTVFAEAESTSFQGCGVVKTADGREITFGISLEMSRSFYQKYESFVQEDYIVTDPLMINLDSNVASVSDQKFMFDLDADGKEESISFAGEGSGFLSLDKNGDGVINDGNELFGTKSGNGFADLAEYDKDGNNWIDESDDVFKDLKVWTKDENGEDKLLSLKEAGIGAIYLGSTSTEFSLKDKETNQTDGIIRRTGVYLKESGEAGTVQHVDLAM